jgi:hypothetical protein
MVDYSEDDALDEILADLLKQTQIFPDTIEMRVKAIFASGTGPRKRAAVCRLLPAPVRMIGDYDYLIVIYQNAWDGQTTERRLQICCHELWHIKPSKNGEPGLREHGGDFCELPDHDVRSKALAKAVAVPEIMANLPRQLTFG